MKSLLLRNGFTVFAADYRGDYGNYKMHVPGITTRHILARLSGKI